VYIWLTIKLTLCGKYMKKIIAETSKIHGKGVFIDEPSTKGSLVAHIKGNILTVKKQLLHTPEEALMNPDWVGISMSYWIDPAVPFKFLNHSCDPTCGIKGKKCLISLKDLKVGDEITIDYSTVEGNPHWQMNCSCGSNNCRGIIKSVAYLPKPLFKKYYPLIPTAFRKFYIKYKKLDPYENPWIKAIKN